MASVTTPTTATTPAQPKTARELAKRRGPGRKRIDPMFFWMVIPAIVLFFVFHTLALLQGVFYSFTDFAGYGSYEFVGFRNYANLFRDPRIIDSYLFTFKFSIVATILTNVVALAIAVGLNAKIKARNLFRGVYFVPNILTILIVGYVFQYLFANSLPKLGESLGIESLSTNILADPNLAWLGIVVVAVWQASAFAIILYLAGLQTVPTDVYEAAAIDGASAWKQFWRITFPLIAPFFTINMVLSLKGFLQVFDLIVAMTNGGPGTSTESISLQIYRGGFEGGEFAYQMANAVIFFIVIVVFSIAQLTFLRRREVSL
jgi:raffinose/stachyose/melibiose transport system permease protein